MTIIIVTINKHDRISAMTESSDTAVVPGSITLGSSIPPGFIVDRGLPGQAKNVSTPPGRLTSLRTRDLTLSGALKKSKVGTEALTHHYSSNTNLFVYLFCFLLLFIIVGKTE